MAMQVLVINLDTQTERLDYQRHQLQQLGLDFVRIPAVTVQQAQNDELPSAYWQTWQRPLTFQERACFLSHKKAWEHVCQTQKPALVLEDDAVLSPHLKELLVEVVKLDGVEHISLEYRGRQKMISNDSQALIKQFNLHRLFVDRTGAAAYILWPNGAKKLLSSASKVCALADAMICQSHDLRSYQIVPALSIQLDMLDQCGGLSPAYAKSAIGTSPGRSLARTRMQRLRRVLAQLHMGWRQLKYFGNAKRTHIPIDINLTTRDKA